MSSECAREVIEAHASPRTPPLVPELTLHLAEEITPIWEAMETRGGGGEVPPPYWAFAWAGSVALARLVLDRPSIARGRCVIDFASGCGLAGLAAKRAGASRVLCVDIDPLAECAASMNAALNGLEIETRTQDLVGRAIGPDWGLVLAGDICYEQPTAGRVIPWLRGLVRDGRDVLLADPGRAYAPSDGLEEVMRVTVPTTRDLESRDSRETLVWRLLRDHP